jgi:predicted deacylase
VTRIDIDWNRDGRQAGYAHLPNSTNESAWQDIRVPIYLLRGGEGPTTLLIGGNHGDEYEGITALSKLAHELEASVVRGSIIIVPALNLPAVLAGSRLSPIDGRNLNREFPGDPRGSITQRIAAFVTTELIPMVDNVVDLHSGGGSLNFAPCAFIHELDDPGQSRRFLEAAEAFSAPLTVVIREPHAGLMIDDVVERAGKVMLSSELGGSAVITPETMRLTYGGILRTLSHLGHLEERLAPPAPSSRLVTVPGPEYYVHADDTATYEPIVSLGEDVVSGQTIGYLHAIDRVDRAPKAVLAPESGCLLCIHGKGIVYRDDVIGLVAIDYLRPI